MVKRGDPPLLALMTVAVDAIERRHLELMAESGFDDVRRAHNSVLANLPAAGMRLTELAHSAGITKQAMAELVEDLQEKGYVEKVPDPSDGRAKLIVWAERGMRAHERTVEIFEAIDADISPVLDEGGVAGLKLQIAAAIDALPAGG